MLFVTHLIKEDGSKWDGPYIDAPDWLVAETVCETMPVPYGFVKVVIVGEFVEEVDFDPEHSDRYH